MTKIIDGKKYYEFDPESEAHIILDKNNRVQMVASHDGLVSIDICSRAATVKVDVEKATVGQDGLYTMKVKLTDSAPTLDFSLDRRTARLWAFEILRATDKI